MILRAKLHKCPVEVRFMAKSIWIESHLELLRDGGKQDKAQR